MDTDLSKLPLSDIEVLMAQANEHMDRASAALRAKHKGGEWDEWRAANADQLILERAVARAKGEEYAEPFNFPVKWSVGAPLPHLVVNDYKTFLTFLVDVHDPKWDGSYVTIKDPKARKIESLALVEFERCASVKFGTPNDEVFSGHPLEGHGLEAYTAQIVHNSRWLRDLEAINSVHNGYKPESWKNLIHYVFWFHDNIFECVARSYKVELFNETFADMLARISQRLTSR